MTETKESVEPTWQEKLGIKDEKTQQLMEIAGQGVSIFALIWIAGQALAVLIALAGLVGLLYLWLKIVL